MLRHQDRLAIPPSALGAAMGWANWPARLQRLLPGPLTGDSEVWLDGGHNGSAARQISGYARHHWDDGKPLQLIFASLTTKDPKAMLEPFIGLANTIHTVAIPGHASCDPADLADLASRLGFSARAHGSVAEALSATPADGRVLVFGSLYLAGEVLAANNQVPD
jgi:dihydrofolate synthase/folylpolyglutamate synthase